MSLQKLLLCFCAALLFDNNFNHSHFGQAVNPYENSEQLNQEAPLADLIATNRYLDVEDIIEEEEHGEGSVFSYEDYAHDNDYEEDEFFYDPGNEPAEYYDPENEPAEYICRRNPTWNNKDLLQDGKSETDSDWIDCRTLMGWKPRDNWWKHDNTSTNEELTQKQQRLLGECLDEAFAVARQEKVYNWTLCNESNRTVACQLPPTHVASHYQNDEEGELVRVNNVFTEQEAFGLESLVACMHKHLGKQLPHYEERLFDVGLDEDQGEIAGLYEYGGNIVTSMQGIIQLYLPGVAASTHKAVRLAYEKANWGNKTGGSQFRSQFSPSSAGWPSPDKLGLRAGEYLEYNHTGRLGVHVDAESVFTISVSLTDAADYEGGYFRLNSEDVLWKAPRLSSVVFFSEEPHGVTEVTSGDRQVFVVEYWWDDDAPVGRARPGHDDFIEFKKDASQDGTCGEDLAPDCSEWAAAGECEQNPGYMLKSCPISCNVCANTV